jgi:hypothetical protein
MQYLIAHSTQHHHVRQAGRSALTRKRPRGVTPALSTRAAHFRREQEDLEHAGNRDVNQLYTVLTFLKTLQADRCHLSIELAGTATEPQISRSS